jgi:pyridoxal phosphate enzyme (YggS family)
MLSPKARIERNLRRIRDDVAAACARVRRDPAGVTIVGVTKSAGLEEIKALLDLGAPDLGESRVQQLCERAGELSQLLQRRPDAPKPRWHMIGHLQRNKVKQVLDAAEVIHSVDTLRLAEEIDARSQRLERVCDVLLEVNASDEPQKFGVAVGAASHLAEMVSTLKHVRLVGLMTMAPRVSDPERARPTFARLRELFEEMRHDGLGGQAMRHLSMGMSQDYAVAVEEGATMLRIGTALFE